MTGDSLAATESLIGTRRDQVPAPALFYDIYCVAYDYVVNGVWPIEARYGKGTAGNNLN